MAPGARSKFVVPMFEPRSFGSKFTVLKKVLVTLLGLFGTWGLCPLAHPLSSAKLTIELPTGLLPITDISGSYSIKASKRNSELSGVEPT